MSTGWCDETDQNFQAAKQNQLWPRPAAWTRCTRVTVGERNVAQGGSESGSVSIKLNGSQTPGLVLESRMVVPVGGDTVVTEDVCRGCVWGDVDVPVLDPGAGYLAVVTW